MDADDWMKTIEKKLQVVQCNNREKVMFASHQLEGLVADWWDAYVEAHEESESINWQEFKNSFRSHQVPFGGNEAQEEGIRRIEARFNVDERVCDSFHLAIPLCSG
jgi:hypothetical protein